jgi:hypothetical protein
MAHSLIAAIAAAGFGLAAVAGAATAAADPDPALPVPVPGGGTGPPPPPDPLYSAAAETRQNPGAVLGDLLGSSTSPVLVLGESMAPGAAGGDPLAAAQTMFPQYYRMPTPDMESPYLLTEDAPAGPFARVDAFRGVHALLHGALGRMPADQLGDPLPGTAPPPGTNIPAGPEQFLPDPAVVLPPPAPQLAPGG